MKNIYVGLCDVQAWEHAGRPALFNLLF